MYVFVCINIFIYGIKQIKAESTYAGALPSQLYIVAYLIVQITYKQVYI